MKTEKKNWLKKVDWLIRQENGKGLQRKSQLELYRMEGVLEHVSVICEWIQLYDDDDKIVNHLLFFASSSS